MLGSSIKLSAIGIPETTGSRGTKKLLNRAAPALLGAVVDGSSALAKNVNITFKHYHPTYLESRLIEVTVTDVNQFLKANILLISNKMKGTGIIFPIILIT